MLRVVPLSEKSDCTLDPLREGVDVTLHRGKKRDNLLPIVAATVTAERPSAQNLHRLRHEYSLASELDQAWAMNLIINAIEATKIVCQTACDPDPQ
jgi:hypothetical protein